MSAIIIGREFLQEVEDMVVELLTDFEEQMVKAMVDNKGLSYGDLSLDPQQRMLKFLDDEMSGMNQALERVDEGESRRRSSQFSRDVERSGAI